MWCGRVDIINTKGGFMRYYTEDKEELQELRAEDWMIECLKFNNCYVHWGPYEDYMCNDGEGWNGRVIKESWSDFGPWELDDLNEVVNFYFEVERESETCKHCDGSGLNEETKALKDSWYSFDETKWVYIDGRKRYNDCAWVYHLTDLEVDALWEAKRLGDFKEKPTPEMVNDWARKGIGHDGINQYICVKARAEHQGVYGFCEACKGKGYVYTKPTAKLGLVLWVLHPRKGCSRGVHIKEIQRRELKSVFEYLKEAEKRNSERFLLLDIKKAIDFGGL